MLYPEATTKTQPAATASSGLAQQSTGLTFSVMPQKGRTEKSRLRQKNSRPELGSHSSTL